MNWPVELKLGGADGTTDSHDVSEGRGCDRIRAADDRTDTGTGKIAQEAAVRIDNIAFTGG